MGTKNVGMKKQAGVRARGAVKDPGTGRKRGAAAKERGTAKDRAGGRPPVPKVPPVPAGLGGPVVPVAPEPAREDPARPGGAEVLLSLSRARDALGLDYDEFDVAVQMGEVRTVACGPRLWKVPPQEVARLRAEEGHPQPLRERVRMVSSGEAARRLGIGRERFVRLARAGHIRPVRWYVNRYRALVWMYLAHELPELAERSPALLHGPLPEGLREAVAQGEDERARSWRARRVAHLVREAYDAWDEAAVWAALLGPEAVDEALPDPNERAHLRKLRTTLPPGRTGPATPEQVRVITTADHPDEIALALVCLADALTRARALRPAPRPPVPPVLPGPAPAPCPPPAKGPSDASALAAASALRPVPTGLGTMRPGGLGGPPGGAGPVPRAVAGSDPVAEAEPWAAPGRGTAARRGLFRLLPRAARRGSGRARSPYPRWPGRPAAVSEVPSHSSPTSVSRMTARPSSSEAARSTSAEMPQP